MDAAPAILELQRRPAHKILLVGAEKRLERILQSYLVMEGWHVITASSTDAALSLARAEAPGMILIDVTATSEPACREIINVIRSERSASVILLMGDPEINHAGIAAQLGPEAWINKPFRPRELITRIRAALRQAGNSDMPEDVVEAAGVMLDVANRCVQVGHRFVDLTPSEFDLLAMLMSAPGRVMSRAELLDVLRGAGETSHQRLIDLHIKNLRGKIEANPRRPRYIHTVYGLGYRFARS